MKNDKHGFSSVSILSFVIFAAVCLFSLYSFSVSDPDIAIGEPIAAYVDQSKELEKVQPKKDIHLDMPESVRGVYVSSYSFMSSAFQQKLDTMIENTTVNAIVVDIKDAPGTILFDIGMENNPCVNPLMGKEKLEERLDYYQQKGIYTIARIAVFRDECYVKQHPELAAQNTSGTPWRDKGGNYWLSPHEMETKEYIRDMAQAVYARGFDEVQFDYVRYPSDGNMSTLAYEYVDTISSSSTSATKRRATLKSFFEYMRSELAGIPLSADVFGMVLTNTDDLTIGQHLDDIAPYVDAISGMIYPSHFPKQWNGIANTHTNPYQTVYDSSKMGLDRMTVLLGTTTAQKLSRPWLQDFSIYGVVYNAPEVKAQIKALEDLGIDSYLLWNASNRYTAGVMTK
jgi:hypothetical protein